MKILLLGSCGQVGWELRRSLAPLGSITALSRGGAGPLRGDLTHLDALAHTVRSLRPDVIVNAAAYTAVDRAEADAGTAEAVNSAAPELLAQEARRIDAWLVHYSTDYVFDGAGERPWSETDTPSPLNVYGATKLKGEVAIQASGCRHLILRTSWVYASRGQNFLRTVLRLAQERDTLQMVADQIGAPTGAELLADLTAHAIAATVLAPEQAGVYHVAAAGEASWYDFAGFVVERAVVHGFTLRTSRQAIEPVPSERFAMAARRPKNSRLNCDKFARTFDLYLPSWQEGVERALTEIGRQSQTGQASS
jgi:dTDP-4-dehydrorhamnose reductase